MPIAFRWKPLSLAWLALSVAAGGCVGLEAPPGDGGGWQTASSVAFSAESFDPGKDWMAIEVRAAHGPTQPMLALNWTWRMDGLPARAPAPVSQVPLPCMVLWAEARGQSIFGIRSPNGQGLLLRTGGAEVDQQYGSGESFSFNNGGLGRPLASNESIAFLFGLNLVASPDTHAAWALRAAEPFEWRVLSQGTMRCGFSPRDFASGQVVSGGTPLGYVTEGTALAQEFELGDAGLLATFVGANVDYTARLRNDTETVWEARWSPAAQSAGTHRWTREGNPWTYEIPHLRNAAGLPTAAYIALPGLPVDLVARAAKVDPPG